MIASSSLFSRACPGGRAPWSDEKPIAFLCPVPGYDRHFAICEEYGIRMLPVPLTGQGPDMDVVEKLVADPSVKGMWCVPQYSNPTGEIYSDETVRRLGAMRTGAPDFRLFWDNAYAVHHLTEKRHKVANIFEACEAGGHPDRAFVFASTSKVTFGGAGLGFFASSPANIAWFVARMRRRTIGPDKLNQLRHVRFLRDADGLYAAHGSTPRASRAEIRRRCPRRSTRGSLAPARRAGRGPTADISSRSSMDGCAARRRARRAGWGSR